MIRSAKHNSVNGFRDGFTHLSKVMPIIQITIPSALYALLECLLLRFKYFSAKIMLITVNWI